MNKKPQKVSDEEFAAALEWFPELRKHLEVVGRMAEEFLTLIRDKRQSDDD
jgi:hypothetical protein